MGAKSLGYKCLEHILKNKKELDIDVVAVLTNESHSFDNKLSIQKIAKLNSIQFIPNLKEYLNIDDFDILLSVQYYNILKKEHIDKAKQIAINLHMAPLPEYRGCNQFSYAIINKDKEFGTTIHKLEEGIDSGPILFEERFEIPKSCFVKELYDLTVNKSFELFKQNIQNIIHGEYNLIEQSSFVGKRKFSIHYRKEIEQLRKIEGSWNLEKIFRYFRAVCMPGFPLPYIENNNCRMYLDLKDI